MKINSAALFLGVASLISMVVSLLREKLIVSALGPSLELDIYYASFKLPDILYTFSIAFISAFVIIPILSKKEEKEAEEFIVSLFRAFIISAFVLSSLAYILTPVYLEYFFSSLYNSYLQADFIFLSRLLLLQFVLLSASQILLSFLQFKQQFIVYALAPILYNVGIVLAAIFLLPIYGVNGLGFGVLLGALMHFILSLVSARLQLLNTGLKIRWQEIFAMLRKSYPRAFSLFIQQILMLFIFAYLAKKSEGAISIFQIALTLQSAPYTIVALSYSVAAFPVLSKLYSQGNMTEFKNIVQKSLWHVFTFSFFAIFPLFLLKEDIINLIFGAKNFGWQDVMSVSVVFSFLLFALVPQSLSILVTRIFYAAGDTFRPLFVHLSAILVFLALIYTQDFIKQGSNNGILLISALYLFYTLFTMILLIYLLKRNFSIALLNIDKFKLTLLTVSFLSFLLALTAKYFLFDFSQHSILASLVRVIEISLIYFACFIFLSFLFKLEFKKLLRILKP